MSAFFIFIFCQAENDLRLLLRLYDELSANNNHCMLSIPSFLLAACLQNPKPIYLKNNYL